MLEPIEKEKAKIWNGRFEKKMKDITTELECKRQL